MNAPWTGRRAHGAAELAARIARVPLFAGIGRRDLARLIRDVEWFGVPGGWTLFREGDAADAVHVVVSGRLAALTRRPDGSETLVAEIGAGETVGEMAILSGERRSATLVALRDSEVIRLPRHAFERLVARNPAALRHVGRLLAQRLARTTRPDAAPATAATVAVIALTQGVAAGGLAQGIAIALAQAGASAVTIGPDSLKRSADWFHDTETVNDHTVYYAGDAASAWARLCMRRADRILFAARAGEAPPAVVPCADDSVPCRSCDLVILHDAGTAQPLGATAWLSRLPLAFHSHVRDGNRGDIARLARLVTGRAVGLVLSGGGARGFAHIGVVRAMREAGLPIDLVGGTSMGAIVAAGVAQEWGDAELVAHMRSCFLKANPLGDITLPLVSLARGRRVERRLRAHFAEAHIENLWRPFFALSGNLTSGRQQLHRRGPVWRALRASTAIPGVLPPLIDDGEVLVDGGVINNFPADVMSGFGRGPVVGVDVGRLRPFGGARASSTGPVERVLYRVRGGRPGIVELLMRAGTISTDARSDELRAHVDLLIEPPVGTIELRDWTAFDRVVEAGYRHAAELFAKLGPSPLRKLSEIAVEPLTLA